MPSDHFKTGPKYVSPLLFELQGHMCRPGATFFLRTGCGQVTFRAVAQEPNDLEKKSYDQNVPLAICNKIYTKNRV